MPLARASHRPGHPPRGRVDAAWNLGPGASCKVRGGSTTIVARFAPSGQLDRAVGSELPPEGKARDLKVPGPLPRRATDDRYRMTTKRFVVVAPVETVMRTK